MRATEINPDIAGEFEDVPNLQTGEKIAIVGTEFIKTQKQNLDGVVIHLANGEKRFSTGAKVYGQLKSPFYQDLITKAVNQDDSLEVTCETVKAEPSGRPMLSLNIFT